MGIAPVPARRQSDGSQIWGFNMGSGAGETARATVAARMPELSGWCAEIFDFGETAWREYRSAARYVEILRREGFTVEEGSGGMPTAFCAEWSNGVGPAVLMYAEYDAVPGNCQQAAPARGPRDGLSVHAGGHTDPHSALGISALGGLLAAKAAMERHGIKGTLRFTGEPAEKVRGSKPIHAARGYYDGLDAILSFHPFYMLPLCNTVRWDTHCGPGYAMIYRFLCEEPERWGTSGTPMPQAHSAVRAPGATDALMQMYVASKMLREAVLPHTGSWSISEAILTAGQATADNLPAGLAEIQYIARVPTLAMAEQVTAALDRNAEAAAAMTGCRWERHWVSKSRPGLANHAMAGAVWDAIREAGPPVWDEAACAIAREVQAAAGVAPMERPFLGACERLIEPQEAEVILRRDLPAWQTHSTSDDYTDMCWHAPTARFYIARPALEAPAGVSYPAWVMNALGGIQATIDPMIRVAAEVLALSALRVLEDEGFRKAAGEELLRRREEGGDIRPLCDHPPPIGFRWPEYVETARGRDWWIPSGAV